MQLPTKEWRLNNLYRIINKDGSSIPFKLNSVQSSFILDPHKRKVTLKARQLGMTTVCVLSMLDDVIFTPNLAAGIVSYSLEHAQHIFKRIIGHALDTWLKSYMPLLNVNNRSAREITFGNGSVLRVDTTLRGGTYPNVLVSEFGKTCARNPKKAEEVITGTLNAVPIDGKVVIESTGEGSEGYFADIVQRCVIRGNENLSALEYKLFFFPWMSEKTYQLNDRMNLTVEQSDYFEKIEKTNGLILTPEQKNWYALQQALLGDKIKQEFPSTVAEAFLSTSDAYYFAEQIEQAHIENRCLYTNPYDPLMPVHVAMDIGVNDLTVIIFFQVCHGEIRIIDYYEDKNKGVDFYAHFMLQEKKFVYGTIFLPHDAARRDNIIVENTYERDFRRIFSCTSTKFHVLKRQDKQLSISHAKLKFSKCVFNYTRVKPLLDQIKKYRKKWSESTGKYLDEPLHDISSNYADAFIYVCQAVSHIETAISMQGALEQHKKVVENRSRRII